MDIEGKYESINMNTWGKKSNYMLLEVLYQHSRFDILLLHGSWFSKIKLCLLQQQLRPNTYGYTSSAFTVNNLVREV